MKPLFENWRKFLGEVVEPDLPPDEVEPPSRKEYTDPQGEIVGIEDPESGMSRIPDERPPQPGEHRFAVQQGEVIGVEDPELGASMPVSEPTQTAAMPKAQLDKLGKEMVGVESSDIDDLGDDPGPPMEYFKDEHGKDVLPTGRFQSLREKWLHAYAAGTNREVWINFLRKTRAQPGTSDEVLNAYYEKNILPRAREAILNMPVHLTDEKHSEYVDALSGKRRSMTPGIYLRKSMGEYDADDVFSHEMGHAIDDKLAKHFVRPHKPDESEEYQTDREYEMSMDMSDDQWSELAHIFPDMDNPEAIDAARACKEKTEKGSEARSQCPDPHSFRSGEIYSNIIDTRRHLGRLFTAEDVARLDDPDILWFYSIKGASKGKWSQEADLSDALQRNLKLEKDRRLKQLKDNYRPGDPQVRDQYQEMKKKLYQEVADQLNTIADLSAPQGPGGEETIDTDTAAPEPEVAPIGFGEVKRNNNLKPIFENWRGFLEEDLESFDRGTLEAKHGLNPELWREERINPQIKETLLQIATDFFDGLGLEDVDVLDIVVTGSLANYNWSKYSDIDLHIIVNFSQVDENIELVRKFFNARKSVWNRTHDIKIKGYEVEVYVEDQQDTHYSSGVYSLLQDGWSILPARQQFDLDWENITIKAEAIMSEIDELEKIHNLGYYEEVLEGSERIKNKIKKLRQSGLESGGEYSIENLAFKVLRRTDYIGRLLRLKVNAYDRSLSIDGEL